MEFFWLIGLLLLLGLAGGTWFVLRRSKHRADSKQVLFARTFSRLLEGRREGLLEDLLQMYKELDHDISIGLALGALYRRMGKLQLALRLHRSLLINAQIDPELRQRIQLEIAKDFLSSGLLERARQEVDRALASGPIFEELRQTAVRIYLALRQWDQASKLAGKGLPKPDSKLASAQIRIEQAEWQLSNGDLDAALAAAKKGLGLNPKNPIAVLTVARVFLAQEQYAKARKTIEGSLDRFGEETWRAFSTLMDVALQMGDHIWLDSLLKGYLLVHDDDWRTKAVYSSLNRKLGNHQKAGKLLLECLEQAPEALFLHQRIWGLLLDMPQNESIMAPYANLMRKELPIRNPFTCVSCGVTSSQYHWQCPNCYQFGSFKERSI